jgi:hypothetical protein
MNTHFHSKDVLKSMLGKITVKLDRQPIRSEVDSFVSYVKNIDFDRYNKNLASNPKYKNMTDAQFYQSLEDMTVEMFISRMKETTEEEFIDVKELLKSEIQKKGDNSSYMGRPKNVNTGASVDTNSIVVANKISLDVEDYHSMQRTLGRDQLLRNANLWFDSRYRDRSDKNTDRYVFHFNNSYSRREGTVNSLGNIRDIIEMEIYPFELPFTSLTNNYYNKLTMLVGEFKQGFISTEGPEFHFIFNTAILPNNMVRLTPINPVYKLRDPITALDTLTLQFKAPLIPVKFDDDMVNVTITYANPAVFTTVNFVSHFLETGDIVYITSFTSDDPIADLDIIALTNRVEGHTINKLSSSEFSCPLLDFSTVTPKANLTLIVFLGSKRAFIPIRIGYILPQSNQTDF